MNLQTLRRVYHQRLCTEILTIDLKGRPNNADKGSKASLAVARTMWQRVCRTSLSQARSTWQPAQTVGKRFEEVTRDYLQAAFRLLQHLRPGAWQFEVTGEIHRFAQYRHLANLKHVLQQHPSLHAALGDYLIHPDIVIARLPIADEEINQDATVISGEDIASLTPLRRTNNTFPLLHASVSCKWTMRSDRAQNVRTEALNLIRHRKGHTPHVVVVTAEPLPGRLASLALGTGDLDCVYHIALPELQMAVAAYGEGSIQEMLQTMIVGHRLRDIADLPFDLVT